MAIKKILKVTKITETYYGIIFQVKRFFFALKSFVGFVWGRVSLCGTGFSRPSYNAQNGLKLTEILLGSIGLKVWATVPGSESFFPLIFKISI